MGCFGNKGVKMKKSNEIDWKTIEKKVDDDIEKEVKEMITQIQRGIKNE